MNHLKSIKLKCHMGGNIADKCAAILVNADRFESAVAFKYEHLSYITNTLENTSDPRFYIWETQKYKEVMDLIRNLVCTTRISYDLKSSLPMGPLFKRICVNTIFVYSQSWETTDIKKKS